MAGARCGVWFTSEQPGHFNNHTSLLKSCIFTHHWGLIIFFHTASGKFSRCPLSASRRSFVQTPWMISLPLKTGSGTTSMCVGGCSPHQPANLGTPAACLTIQLNSAILGDYIIFHELSVQSYKTVWSGLPRWLLSCSLYLPCFTYTLLTWPTFLRTYPCPS